MKSLWLRHPYLVSAFGLAAALTLFFAAQVTIRTLAWEGHQNEPVQAWMTVGYVGHSWDLDPREIDALAGLPLPEGEPLTLTAIARDRGVPVAEVIAAVEAAVATLRAQAE